MKESLSMKWKMIEEDFQVNLQNWKIQKENWQREISKVKESMSSNHL